MNFLPSKISGRVARIDCRANMRDKCLTTFEFSSFSQFQGEARGVKGITTLWQNMILFPHLAELFRLGSGSAAGCHAPSPSLEKGEKLSSVSQCINSRGRLGSLLHVFCGSHRRFSASAFRINSRSNKQNEFPSGDTDCQIRGKEDIGVCYPKEKSIPPFGFRTSR